MIDAETLAWEHDEEGLGFEQPPAAASASLGAAEKTALASVGLGLLALLVQVAGGPLAGTWPGFALSFGLLALGGVGSFALAARRAQRSGRRDGAWFRGLFARGAAGWLAGILMTGFYVLIYWFPQTLGQRPDGAPVGLVRVVDPLSRALTGQPASQWFLYGVLYTLAIAVFGARVLVRHRNEPYARMRTLSVMTFQSAFAWLLPNLLVRFQKPYMELNGVWPLKYDYLWPNKVLELRHEPGAIATFLLFWALALALLATPVLTYFYGKRWYCSWVCGCGGLAETLGDSWRHLSDNSTRAWRIERWMIHSVLVLVLATTTLVWASHAWGLFPSAAGALKQGYGFAIGAVFSGVVGVGFYPLLGSRVWCRFGCPQAALLGLFQRFFSRFRITTNGDQCMSCGNCSTACEMGIDVRSYAQKGENIVRASCVGCGVCAAVCPRGVLKLENGSTHADRFDGAGDFGRNLVDSLRMADRE